MGISAAAVRHRIRMVILENGSFLLDGEFAVSTCVGARGDVVSPGGNNFYDFSSLLHLSAATSSILLMWHSFMRDRNHLIYGRWDCP
jgi:hypothetical protein